LLDLDTLVTYNRVLPIFLPQNVQGSQTNVTCKTFRTVRRRKKTS